MATDFKHVLQTASDSDRHAAAALANALIGVAGRKGVAVSPRDAAKAYYDCLHAMHDEVFDRLSK